MKLLLAVLPSLAMAGAVIPRQSSQVIIKSISASGTNCPAGSYPPPQIYTDGQTGSIIFTKFKVEFADGLVPAGERDLDCIITFTLQFPSGCRRVTPRVGFHGIANLEKGGATGDLEPSFVVHPGVQITNVNVDKTTYSTLPDWDFIRVDTPTLYGTAPGTVTFEAHTRMRVITTSSKLSGVVGIDAVDIALSGQTAC